MTAGSLRSARFIKMHALGNDFVLIDGRNRDIGLDAAQAALIADRHLGIGGDQVLTLTTSASADIAVRFQNVDGRDAEACGNATRCVARFLFAETGQGYATIATPAGDITAFLESDDRVRVIFPPPRMDWSSIALTDAVDTRRLPLASPSDEPGVAVNIGNPHAVFFGADLDDETLTRWGPRLEHDPLFSNGANIGFARIINRRQIRLRVWERSAGLTRACGTGSCAAVVAAHVRGLTDRHVAVEVDGGQLDVDWADDGRLHLTGEAASVGSGAFSRDFIRVLERLRLPS